jgi:PAS domain S-box-containing protein
MSTIDDRSSDLFSGSGEIRTLARSIDWGATSLGEVENWSATLRTTVRTCLESPFPLNLWCGPELVLIYNDAYSAVLGNKHPAALGRPGWEVWAEIWPEIAPMFDRMRGGGPPAYADDAPFHIDRVGTGVGQRSDQPNAWFTFALSPVRDDDGEIVAFLNIVSETTGRLLAERSREVARARAERAEARLYEMFARAPAFMAMLRGEDHVFEFVNDAYYQLVGHRELIGRPLVEALPEVRTQGFETLLDDVMNTGNPYVGREVPILLTRTESGEAEERFVDFVYYPITEGDGTRSGVVAHGSDVTEHVHARQEAQRARAEAEEANQAKSQFLANMSHEIRTPINAIMGYTELLELGVDGPVTERQRAQLERVRISSRHLLMLIDDILDLAKVESGRTRVDLERLPVGDTVAAAIALVGPQASMRGIGVANDCGMDGKTFYIGDEDRVRQILANLLSNAVKFTPSGGQIRITCGTSSTPDTEVETSPEVPLTFISVQDTGIGIAPEDMRMIFNPFMQVERGHTRTRGGSGLGLTISRHLARIMGGDLVAESVAGEGSTFTLWLPGDAALAAPLAEAVLGEVHESRPPNLAAVGIALRRGMPLLLDRFSSRLRSDAAVPTPTKLTEADLLDHTAAGLADVADTLISLETAPATAEILLRDGSEIQRLICDLHGRQRARLGWGPEELAREWSILAEETETTVRRAFVEESGTELEGAINLLKRILERGERISRRALRHSRAVSNGPVR